MWLSVSDATHPTYSRSQLGVLFMAFSSVNVDTVLDAVQQLPDKSSAADPMPTSILKKVADLIAPFFTELFNRSLAAGYFQSGFKEAFITPIVRKLAWIRLTLVHIDRSQTCQFYPSFLNASLFSSWWPTYRLLTYFLRYSLVSDRLIPQKPPSSRFCRSYH